MPQKDLITSPVKVSKSLTYDQKQLYKYFHKWFEERHYVVVEKEYSEKVTPERKRVYAFEWYTEKRAEYYTKLVIEISFEAEVEHVKVELHDGKKKTAQQGDVSVTFQGYVLRDVGDEWAMSKTKPHLRVLREAYDRLVARGKTARFETQLKKDIRAIVSDFKTYLNTHKYD